mgnify:CR=1 FL=1
MLTSTVENYLKAIYLLDPAGNAQITTGELAASLSVTPGSATAMIKTLAEASLIKYRPHYGVRLTEQGQLLAIRVVRRHRIIELFLVQILGMDWGDVHEEAEQLEHVVSDQVIERMDTLLGSPTVDPHGDSIPSSSGNFPKRVLHRLATCSEGEVVSIARIGNQNTEFLKFAEESGLLIGANVKVISKNETADSITLQSNNKRVVLGLAAANKIEIEHA